MKKMIYTITALFLSIGLACAGTICPKARKQCPYAAHQANIIARFEVITDIHHTNKPDTTSRKYSAALDKAEYFVHTMNRAHVDFIIELGDLVDTLVDDKDPVQNLSEIESIFFVDFDG